MDVLKLLGGVALFLYGMKVMGASLEKIAGSRLKEILGKMTSNIFKGFGFGLLVTAVIQSSAATIVMVVGFVNSGLMSLVQACGVIMGANIGTAVTGWIVSASSIKGSDSIYYALLFVGVVMFWFLKKNKQKHTGLIIIGFSVLMIGMQTMSASVAGLKDSEFFSGFIGVLSNPLLGLLFGIVFTAIIQSSSASVGVLQSFAIGYALPFSLCIPYVMGANIGTCSTALISSIGASKEAKRSAMLHLMYNVLATAIILPVYCIIYYVAEPAILSATTNAVGIAIVNTIIKISELILMFPCAKILCRIVTKLVPDDKNSDDKTSLLDERLLATPEVALERARTVTIAMAELSLKSLKASMDTVNTFDQEKIDYVEKCEDLVDTYEDKLGTFLVKLSGCNLLDQESKEVNMLLHLIGDYERISDHATNIIDSASELREKKIEFTGKATEELRSITGAVSEILDLSYDSFINRSLESASLVEPLEEVVDNLKDELKARHIKRLQKGECTIELGFVLTDVLTDLERVSDHCSNIALCVIETNEHLIDRHEYIREIKAGGSAFERNFEYYRQKYMII